MSAIEREVETAKGGEDARVVLEGGKDVRVVDTVVVTATVGCAGVSGSFGVIGLEDVTGDDDGVVRGNSDAGTVEHLKMRLCHSAGR